MSPAPDSVPTIGPECEADSGDEDRSPDEEQRTNAPSQDNFRASARPNRFQEPLNDTTGRPRRVFRKTPPRTRGQRSRDMDPEETLGHVEGEQAGAADATQPTLDFSELCALSSGSPTEDIDAELNDFADHGLSASSAARSAPVDRK